MAAGTASAAIQQVNDPRRRFDSNTGATYRRRVLGVTLRGIALGRVTWRGVPNREQSWRCARRLATVEKRIMIETTYAWGGGGGPP